MLVASIYIPIIIILGIIVAVLSFYLVLHRFFYLKRVSHRQATLQRLNSVVLEFLSSALTPEELGGQIDLKKDLPFLRQVLITNMGLVKGSMRDKLIGIYREFEFYKKDIENLKSRKWWIQAAAARDMSVLLIPESSSHLKPLLDHQRLEVRLIAAYALGRLGDHEVIGRIMEEAARANEWIKIRLVEIVKSMKDTALPELRKLLKISEKPEVLILCTQVLGSFRDDESGGSLAALCEHEETEVRIKAVKALGDMRYAPAVETLINLLDEDQWEIRSLACKSLGRIGNPAALDKLHEKLRDPNWWVRHNAAGAMMRMGGSGIEKLRQSAESDPDRFARETARESLEQHELLMLQKEKI